MRLLPLALLSVSLPVSAAQSVNRIQMDNGREALWWLSSPSLPVGDPANGVVTGDMYWKVLPANASRQCDGVMTFLGLEAWNYDQDWTIDEALYGFMISESNLSTSGNLFPEYITTPTAPAAYVPPATFTGTALPFFGNPLGPGGCPPPNYLSGWLYQDVVSGTGGGFIELTADGSIDWSISVLVTPGMDLSLPDPNTCGSFAAGFGGNFTFSWAGSSDTLQPGFGENMPNLHGDGSWYGDSPYGGRGSGGVFGASAFHEGSELAFLIGDSATIQPYVNAGAGLLQGDEMGLAGNVLGIGLDLSCASVGTATLGVKMFDGAAQPGDLAVFFGNVGPTLLDLGVGCVPFAGAELGLNPSDPAFLPVFSALGAPAFGTEVAGQQFQGSDYGGFIFGDKVATSNRVPLGLGCGSIGTSLQLQGFRFSGLALAAESQLFTILLAESGTIQ